MDTYIRQGRNGGLACFHYDTYSISKDADLLDAIFFASRNRLSIVADREEKEAIQGQEEVLSLRYSSSK